MQDDPLKDVTEDDDFVEPIIDVTDVGSVSASEEGLFGIGYAKIEVWDVDLGEFLNDVEDESGIVLKQSDVKPWDVDLGEFLKNLYLYSVKFLYKQPVSTIVAGLAFVCLLVAAVSLVLLISTFLG